MHVWFAGWMAIAVSLSVLPARAVEATGTAAASVNRSGRRRLN
jgi:hypothetical protein